MTQTLEELQTKDLLDEQKAWSDYRTIIHRANAAKPGDAATIKKAASFLGLSQSDIDDDIKAVATEKMLKEAIPTDEQQEAQRRSQKDEIEKKGKAIVEAIAETTRKLPTGYGDIIHFLNAAQHWLSYAAANCGAAEHWKVVKDSLPELIAMENALAADAAALRDAERELDGHRINNQRILITQ